MKNILVLTVLMILLSMSDIYSQKQSEDVRIRHLINYVSGLENAVFIRNGTEHEAKEAAEHLEMKWQNAGRRVRTAEQFIDRVATKSFLTGNIYYIIMPDGKRRPSSEVLYEALRLFDR